MSFTQTSAIAPVCVLAGAMLLGSAGGCARNQSTQWPTECPVHGVAIRDRLEPVSSGRPQPPPGYFDARRAGFPYANPHLVEWSCLPTSEPQTRVRSCPECDRLEAEWLSREGVTFGN